MSFYIVVSLWYQLILDWRHLKVVIIIYSNLPVLSIQSTTSRMFAPRQNHGVGQVSVEARVVGRHDHAEDLAAGGRERSEREGTAQVEPDVYGDDFVYHVVDSSAVANLAPDCDGQGYGLVVRNDLLDTAALGTAVGGSGSRRGWSTTGIAGVRAHEVVVWCVDGADAASQGVQGERVDLSVVGFGVGVAVAASCVTIAVGCIPRCLTSVIDDVDAVAGAAHPGSVCPSSGGVQALGVRVTGCGDHVI